VKTSLNIGFITFTQINYTQSPTNNSTQNRNINNHMK